MSIKHVTDEDLLAACDQWRPGVSELANRLGVRHSEHAAITRRMLRLEKRGLVYRCPIYSTASSYIWYVKEPRPC